ncbi:MAG TPA: protein kinase [Candidatus Polarisedimenticolaceae bacterium]|nr:protein kinase [Candidatus Polarisedimenticolaceae bacterium]
MPITVGSRLGVYEVIAALGAGAMGEVWRARDTRLSREVALKVLPASLSMDAERRQRFEREAQVLASLNHPNIAAIYGVEEAEGSTALVLELVEGPTLAERIAEGPIPNEEAVAIAKQIAEALEYAHERGVVHRDLKPANVKLSPDGRVKVLDFGLAKAIAADATGRSDSAISPTITSLGTVAGVILGTAAYMAPEQARGSNIDRRADIWSFGAVLWEILTGKRLFDDATVSDTLAAVLRAPIEWDQLPKSTPPAIVRLLKRCLERDTKKRLRDIGEARIALESPIDEPVAVASSVVMPPKRSPLATVAWAAAVIVVALTGLAAVGFLRKPSAESRVLRFQIPLENKMAAITWSRVSPDGTMLAFLARGESGRASIWIRRLDAFESQELSGTEGAGRFWWSPDSRFLAFFLGNQLKKVPAASGPVQLIGEADGGSDGTWGAGGAILFDGRAIDPLRRIDAAGGGVTQENKPDTANGEAGQTWPCFLPDGKHFLFVAQSNVPGEKTTIKVAELGKPGSKSLARTSSRVEYASGYLVYVLDGNLVAHRFDVDKLALSGEPIPLAEHIATDANGAATFSVSTNGDLTYLPGAVGVDSELMWVDRAGKELDKLGPPAGYREPALSPDGTRVAYGLADPRGNGEDIWVMDLKRAVASRFTFDPGVEIWPVWSRDGRQLTYTSDKTGSFNIYVKDASGTGTERDLTPDKNFQSGPLDYSPDGKWLAVDFLPPSRRWQIKMIPTQGELKATDYLTDNVVQVMGRFSPNGRFVAYASNESGTREVYVQSFPIGSGKWQVSSGGGEMPLWRSDGKELFYKTLVDEFVAVPVTTEPRFELGAPKNLFKRAVDRSAAASVGTRFAVTPDGQKFLINSAREGRGLPVSVIVGWPQTLAR